MTQTVTPELRQWIIEQSSTGCMPEAVLEAMVKAGWQADVAEAALEQTLRDHLQKLGAGRAVAPAPSQVSLREMGVVRVPEVALSGAPRRLDAGDRLVDVIISVTQPRVVVFGGLLSDDECDGLIAAATPRLARSLTVQTSTGGEELNPDRTSNGMFFTRGEGELVRRIEARIARLVNWPVENGEGIQVLNYQVGAEYKPHYDYFDPGEPGTPTILKRGGQRVATVVMYLNEPGRGGGTTFPDIGLEVAPVRGNAVFFSYNRPHPGTLTLHGGAPVLEGEKWVATKWMRERVFE
jgi:prolyl 4-hydroxylase